VTIKGEAMTGRLIAEARELTQKDIIHNDPGNREKELRDRGERRNI